MERLQRNCHPRHHCNGLRCDDLPAETAIFFGGTDVRRWTLAAFGLFVLPIAVQAADSDRNHIMLPRDPNRAALPFSDAVLVGNTLYVAGHIGRDPATGKVTAMSLGKNDPRPSQPSWPGLTRPSVAAPAPVEMPGSSPGMTMKGDEW